MIFIFYLKQHSFSLFYHLNDNDAMLSSDKKIKEKYPVMRQSGEDY
jgi:hypothetical protein